MSKFDEDIIKLLFCRRATLTCGTLFILVVLFIVICEENFPTKEIIAIYTYGNYGYNPKIKQANPVVSDASSVMGSEEWMSKKEDEFEARRAHVQEVCAKLNSEDRWREPKQGKHFWFDIRHGIALCAHAKVMRNDFSVCLLDGVQKGARRKVCPKHRYHKMACSMVYSKSLLMNVVKTFPIV